MLPRRFWCAVVMLSMSACTGAPVPHYRPAAPGHDWPQWQGPARDAVSQETGLLQSWPSGGPSLVWRVKGLGGGYSGPAVADGRLFGMSYRGEDEVVWALEEDTGKELWTSRIAAANRHISSPGQEGSRCTPTVEGAQTYVLGVSGDLVCLDTASGKEIWRHNLVADFGGRVPSWGYSESPLVDGDKVLATPGGDRATLVALDKKTGGTIWQAHVPGSNAATYSSIIAADVDGQRQYVQLLNGGVVGVEAANGKFLWRYVKPGHGISCSTPLYHDHLVFAASGYGVGGGAARLTSAGNETHAAEVYFSNHMKNHHGGIVLVDGYLYGSDDPRSLVCLEFQTGKIMWESTKPGKGSIAYADGRLYYRNEDGPVVLVEANPNSYVERGRFNQPERSGQKAWPHPVIANGRLYLRDQDLLLCYDVKSE